MATPKSLTKTAISKLTRDEIAEWAEQHCLLEHLDRSDIAALNKTQLVDEVMGALLRAEIYEDHRACATDSVSRPLEDLI